MKREKKPRFDFLEMKANATHTDPAVRKKAFEEYFERFEEFPSYLFDNERGIDETLLATVTELDKDPTCTKAMRAGIAALLDRLPSRNL